MKALRYENQKLAVSDVPEPRVDGEAVVRVTLSGICNTDLEIARGYAGFEGTIGHEFVGVIESVSEARASARASQSSEPSLTVGLLTPGQRVVGEINAGCGNCELCRAGDSRHCARRTVLGIVGRDGAHAEFLKLPPVNLLPVPGEVSDERAVFIEPLAAACEILKQIDVRHFRSAAVLGDGKLAQLIALVLRTKLPRVVMYGKHKEKLKLARQAKIETQMVAGDECDREKLRDTFALVVEATGSPTGLRLALQMTEPHGTLVLKSTFHRAAPVETWPIVVKELSIIGSRCGPFGEAIGLLKSGEVDPSPLITKTFSLGEAPQAIQFAQERGVMKALLKP